MKLLLNNPLMKGTVIEETQNTHTMTVARCGETWNILLWTSGGAHWVSWNKNLRNWYFKCSVGDMEISRKISLFKNRQRNFYFIWKLTNADRTTYFQPHNEQQYLKAPPLVRQENYLCASFENYQHNDCIFSSLWYFYDVDSRINHEVMKLYLRVQYANSADIW
jgi:hypothetical protein